MCAVKLGMEEQQLVVYFVYNTQLQNSLGLGHSGTLTKQRGQKR